MKIGSHVLTLNDAPYIWWSLKSSYPAVDYIAVIEGAITHDVFGNAYHQVPASPLGLSLDNTAAEVERFMAEDDPEGKVHFTQVGFVHSWEDLRNAAHEALPQDTDIEMIQDGDCLFNPNDIENARFVLEHHPQVFEVANYCHSFIWDFQTVMKTGIPHKDYWRWCFFRYHPDMYFEKERTIAYRNNQQGSFRALEEDRVKIDWVDYLALSEGQRKGNLFIVYGEQNLLQVYHFGNVQEKERMEMQLMRKFFSPQTRERNRLDLPDLSRETLVNWLKLYHKYYTQIPDTDIETFEPFTGTYPLEGLIQTHPYFDKPREWFRHDDEKYDTTSPFYLKEWWGM